jgi:hypothetical protein
MRRKVLEKFKLSKEPQTLLTETAIERHTKRQSTASDIFSQEEQKRIFLQLA